jgi:hypothetical protein
MSMPTMGPRPIHPEFSPISPDFSPLLNAIGTVESVWKAWENRGDWIETLDVQNCYQPWLA